MLATSSHVVTSLNISSVFTVDNVPFYGYVTFYFSVHQLIGQLVYFYFLTVIDNADTNIHMCICVDICFQVS